MGEEISKSKEQSASSQTLLTNSQLRILDSCFLAVYTVFSWIVVAFVLDILTGGKFIFSLFSTPTKPEMNQLFFPYLIFNWKDIFSFKNLSTLIELKISFLISVAIPFLFGWQFLRTGKKANRKIILTWLISAGLGVLISSFFLSFYPDPANIANPIFKKLIGSFPNFFFYLTFALLITTPFFLLCFKFFKFNERHLKNIPSYIPLLTVFAWLVYLALITFPVPKPSHPLPEWSPQTLPLPEEPLSSLVLSYGFNSFFIIATWEVLRRILIKPENSQKDSFE